MNKFLITLMALSSFSAIATCNIYVEPSYDPIGRVHSKLLSQEIAETKGFSLNSELQADFGVRYNTYDSHEAFSGPFGPVRKELREFVIYSNGKEVGRTDGVANSTEIRQAKRILKSLCQNL